MPEEERQVPVRPRYWPKRLRIMAMILVPALLIGGGLWYYISTENYVSTGDAYIAGYRVTISPQVAGRVIEVPVHQNETVAKGEVVLRLDSAPYLLAVRAAEIKVSAAAESVAGLKAKYQALEAQIAGAGARVAYLQREIARLGPLARSQVIANSKLDRLSTEYTEAGQQVAALRAEQKQVLARLGGSPDQPLADNAEYRAAEAALAKAKLDLSYTVVRAPAAGIVTKVTTRPGDVLAPGTPAFPLLETGRLWVRANFKETALTRLRPGAPVTVTVDSYPGVVYHGHVASISPGSGAVFSLLPPENASGNWVKVVQRFPVRIELDHPHKGPVLRVGMSAKVTVYVGVQN